MAVHGIRASTKQRLFPFNEAMLYTQVFVEAQSTYRHTFLFHKTVFHNDHPDLRKKSPISVSWLGKRCFCPHVVPRTDKGQKWRSKGPTFAKMAEQSCKCSGTRYRVPSLIKKAFGAAKRYDWSNFWQAWAGLVRIPSRIYFGVSVFRLDITFCIPKKQQQKTLISVRANKHVF